MIPEPGRTESRPQPESGPTVLIVEDEDALRATVRRLLQAGRRVSVLEAQNGARALQLLDTDSAKGWPSS